METIILIAVFGLSWGSFLNVIIYRLPRRISLVKPPSSCPRCHQKIRFYDNIPLLSFILLGGKCRHCNARIPLSYPLVELLTPLGLLLLYSKYALSFGFIAASLFFSALIILGFIDFYHQILPDEITLPALALALIYSFFRSDLSLRQALVGAAAGAGFLLFVYGAYYLLRKREGLGMGDVTMMLMIGAYLGLRLTVLTLILASLAGAVFGSFFILVKKKSLQVALPFGSFLAVAGFVALLWGDKIITSYFSLYENMLP